MSVLIAVKQGQPVLHAGKTNFLKLFAQNVYKDIIQTKASALNVWLIVWIALLLVVSLVRRAFTIS
jgi:hypothetical protein